ncbi:hypothetical protein [Streptomyces huiliensis]|uniref:hypothetical protein n=1 Tax=Streptomyces huiliensis TaxID=2876027 RepID=UPI001CBA6CDA|nr:hypothetical protein [Streptomyces huiliensis]MBZ4319394.1 hypothetical protein [Streptomyces huiliensis]
MFQTDSGSQQGQALAMQAPVLARLAELAVSYPSLPGAYFCISRHCPRELSVQLDGPVAVEAWREALDVPVEEVVMRRLGDRPSLEFRAAAYGLWFHVYAVYDQVGVARQGVA